MLTQNKSEDMTPQFRRLMADVGDKRKKLQQSMKCLVPGCNSTAIKSHSQQKGVALNSIAHAGHVLTLKRDVTLSRLDKVGINEASTFKGFCNTHDTKLFADLETFPLAVGNPQVIRQAFLRAIAHEYVRKIENTGPVLDVFNGYLASNPDAFSEGRQIIIESFQSVFEGIANNLSLILAAIFEGELPLQWIWATVPGKVDYALCTTFSLPKNEQLKLHSPELPATCTIIPTESESHFIFAWPEKYRKESRQLQRMLKQLWSRTLNAIMFYLSEDCSFALTALNEEQKSLAAVARASRTPVSVKSIVNIPKYANWSEGTFGP